MNKMFSESKDLIFADTNGIKLSLEYDITDDVTDLVSKLLKDEIDYFEINGSNPNTVISIIEKHFDIDTSYIQENGWQCDVWWDITFTLPDNSKKDYTLEWGGYMGSVKIYKELENE